MPAPTYVGNNTGSGTGNINLAWPAHQTDDVALLVIETGGEGTTLTPPSGWTAITSTPVTDIANATGSKLHCWWRRATSNAETSVATGDSGDHQAAVMTTYRGCATIGNPFDVTTTGSKTTASTTSTVPAVTTTVGQTLIVGIIGRPDDSSSATEYSGYTNANLTSITERREFGTTSGHGGGMVVFTGIKSTAGNTGTTSVTKATSTTDTYIVVALRPPPLILTADKGTFTLAGQAANLAHDARLTADKGAYALTGNAATLSKGGTPLNAYTLTAAAGTFTETGQAANLTRTRSLAADKGTVTLSGQPAGTRATRYLAADFAKYFLPERNLIARSEEINTWTLLANTTVTSNAAIAPDGTLTAEKVIVSNVTNASVRRSQLLPAFRSGQSYVLSCYVKAAELTSVAVFFDTTYTTTNYFGSGFWLNLSTGSPSNANLNVQNVGDGWYRVWLVQTADNDGVAPTGGHQLSITPGSTGNVNSVSGNGVNGIYVWGAQFEEGTSPSAYDPTGPVAAATTVTRVTRRLVADLGAFTLTGRDAGLVYASSKKIVADAGAFTLTGQPAALRKSDLLLGAAGSFTLTGNAAGLVRGARLTAAAGAFTETGNAATLSATRRLVSAAGVFTLSGQPAGTRVTRYLAADFAKYFLPERNLRLWSEAFDNAAWTKTNASIIANVTTAPDGTLTADALIENTTQSVGHQVARNITYISGRTYTASCYFKLYPGPITRYVRLQLGSATVFGTDTHITINLATGVIAATQGSPSATSITNEGNGWYRASLTKQYTGAGVTTGPAITLVNTVGTALYTDADGLSGVYIWGAQYEEGSLSAYDPVGPAAAAITNTTATRRLLASAGSIALTGNAAALRPTRLLTAAAGSFTLTGQAAAPRPARRLTAATGTFALTGNDAVLIKIGAAVLPSAAGLFTLTGQAATLRATRSLTAAAGLFTLTGNAATLARRFTLTASAGSFTETGQAATLRRTVALGSAAGAFTLSGKSAGFQGQRYLPLAPGAFIVTGQAAVLRRTVRLTAAAGAFTATGQAAALRPARRLVASPAAFTETGQAAALRRTVLQVAAPGSFTVTGQDAALKVPRRLIATTGSFAATGQPATLRRAITVVASAGAATVTGAAATLRRTVRLASAPATFIVSGQSAGFLGQRYMPLAPGAFALTGQLADLRFNRRLQGSAGTFLATGPPADLKPNYLRRRVIIF